MCLYGGLKSFNRAHLPLSVHMGILELKGLSTGKATRLWSHLESSDTAVSVLVVGPKFPSLSSADNLHQPRLPAWLRKGSWGFPSFLPSHISILHPCKQNAVTISSVA